MKDPDSDARPGTPAMIQPESLAELGARLAEVAREYDIPLDADNALTGRLSRIAPADEIPERVYSGVTALLAFLREVEEQAGD